MIINGKDRKFLLTIGASAEISDLCPQGDLARLGEVFNQSYAKQIRERFHVPVLDVNTMIGYMAYAIGQMKMYD